MEKGSRYANRFTILSVAGSGGTANVYKAFDDEENTVVALKVFTVEGRDPDVVTEFWNREAKALSALQHDSIAKFLGAGREPVTAQRYIVLEWIDGNSLEQYFDTVGKQTWDEFNDKIGKPILSALVHAAENNVCHRDLSTGNVLVTTAQTVKIIDFGQAKISNAGIGRTVAGWRTAPYCPPEEDTGTHTLTRDPFAFCAIAVRAIAGYQLKDHDALYGAFDEISIPPRVREVFGCALNRDPRRRYANSIEFQLALEDDLKAAPVAPGQGDWLIPVRISPTVHDRFCPTDIEGNPDVSAIEQLFRELNDTVALSPAVTDPGRLGTRIDAETQSYRVVFDVDSARADHLVVIHLVQKRFRLDSLYQVERWMPQGRFTPSVPLRSDERVAAKQALESLYRGLEEFQATVARTAKRDGGAKLVEWGRLLEALRYVARYEVPPLTYTKLESEGGAWLNATVENPEDAQPEQVRTIDVEGRWVFRGEVHSIVGNQCILVSTRPRIDLDAIPGTGRLENDWQQAKVALDRQGRALERFKGGDLPSPRLGKLLTGEEAGTDAIEYGAVKAFLDKGLDPPKKEVVSRCASGVDVLVVHGPPGTGKTKLIVELLRQTLHTSPDSKILLVSQTHVALDNALERLLKQDPDAACVRIGSGSKEIDPRVERCTVENRGIALRKRVEESTRQFVEARARTLGVDPGEISLGLRAFDVLGLRDSIASVRRQIQELESELPTLREGGVHSESMADAGTAEKASRQLRQRAVSDSLDKLETQLQLAEAELAAATQRLNSLGKAGRELASATSEELRKKADSFTQGSERRTIGDLMALADEWALRFGQSDDFKAAIIASSSIVAGTCVGFCREEAASKATFDLCIVDEAGKATTTELLVPLAQSRRAIIVGDHHQLPAVIDHAIQAGDLRERFELTDEQIQVQLFEELTKRLAGAHLAKLTVQYRMRGAIGALISECFYGGDLDADKSVDEREVIDLETAGLERPVTWIDPYKGSGRDRFDHKNGTSFVSEREVNCVVSLLKRIAFVLRHSTTTDEPLSIAVITGYAAQANQIRSAIRREAILDGLNVECATVHSFQGREVDIAIYSVARRNREHKIGMLSDWRHLNVALSRARDYLVIVGGMEFCRNVPDPNPFRKIVEFIESSEECDVRDWSDD